MGESPFRYRPKIYREGRGGEFIVQARVRYACEDERAYRRSDPAETDPKPWDYLADMGQFPLFW